MPPRIADAKGRPRPRLLVFVHIPKTAGTTLRAVLSMNGATARSWGLGNVFKGGGGISEELINRLRKGQGPDLRGVGLVRGHFPLGVRECLSQYVPKGREVHCFTLVRKPADRTLSHFFAIRGDDTVTGGLPPLPADATLEEALERGYVHDNLQTRMLSGLVEPFGEVTDEMLEQAKRNLREELIFFGVTERFDESLVLARRRLGLDTILYGPADRVNTVRPRGTEIPEDLVRTAEACNRYDTELYRYAQELFEDAPERKEPGYEVELAALRAVRADGEAELAAPAPAGYSGDAQEWRMLLHATVRLLHTEQELAKSALRAATVRARMRKLEQEVERLGAVPTKTKELQQEVQRLEATSARTDELEREVGRLRTAASRAKKLEQQVERLKADGARTAALEAQVERLEAAALSRPRRESRSGPQGRARSRPKRETERAGSKRPNPDRAKARRRSERARSSGGPAGPNQGGVSDGG